VQTLWIRRFVGGVGLIAGLWLALGTSETPAKAPTPIPAEVSGKMIDSDIAFLQKGLEKTPEKAAVPTLKSTAMLIALYAQNNLGGKDADAMAALRAQALKVAEALNKKDYKAASTEAGKLKSPPASTDKKALKLHEMHKFDLSEVMSTFRNSPRGLNIEKDIRDQAKAKAPDLKVSGEAAAHSILLGEFMTLMPSEKAAANPANQKKWDGYTADMTKLAKEIVEESTKGDKADKMRLKANLSKLDGSCTACHNEFRE